ncbi:MAG: hypothetical protein QME61_02780 [Patescibacteria group bacterium]|nr:hypothetical protein [Patescibacteria group bacterium]
MAALIGIAGFYYYQKNIYSKEILKLEILGEREADFLEEIEYIVKYKNNGNIRLEEPELIFEYPENSLPIGEKDLRIIKKSDELGGAIYPGEEKTLHFKAKLLGKEGEAKIAKAWLSYRPKNLKAQYESATTFTTVIKKVPLTFEFDLPTKIESGKEFRFRLNYFSNVDDVLSDLRVQIEYPFGFEFIESNPKSLEKVEWEIPVLNKGEGGRIEISGRISGEVGEAKIFRAKLGIWKEGEFILLKEAEKGVEIIKPSIYLRQEINGNPQYVALPGDWLHFEIYFKNIGDEDLNNLFMINKLEGEAFDFQTLKSDLGNFEPGDDSIIFDWRRVPKLQYLAPMEEGKVEFWIKLKEDLGNVKNPVLRNKVFISQIKQEFVTKISSKLEIVQKGYFQDEVFGNSGPLPPKVGEKTTYTIMWQVKNYYSDVKEVKVKAILPIQVNLTGKIFPEEETSKFAFDSESREIVWSVGDLERGKGVFTTAPNISFQIEFLPMESQKGQTPEIISQAEISGEDTWTETTLKSTAPAINTTLPDDETITEEMGIVQ